MDSINKNQPEHNHEDLSGAAAVKKLTELVKAAETCFFCTSDNASDHGHGASRPMSVLKTDEQGNLWFMSADDSHKNAELQANPQVRLGLGRLERAFIYSGGIVSGPDPNGGLIGLTTLLEPAAARPLREANGDAVQQPGVDTACTVSAGCQAARLESPAPIPEPSTYVMLLAGLALVVWGAGRQGTPLFVR